MDSTPTIKPESAGHRTPNEIYQIQPHGAVLVLDHQLRVIQYSENLSKLLEIPIHQISVTPIANFLNPEDPKDNILAWLSNANNQYKRLNWRAKQKKITIWAYIQQRPEYIILEIEPIAEDLAGNDGLFNLSQYVIDSAKTSTSSLNLQKVLQNTCEEIRKITEYDRVLIYQLGKNQEPCVIVGEAAKKGLQSYLGLHFPSSYIPTTTRDKYLNQPLKYIPSINITAVNIFPPENPTIKAPTDLSLNNLSMITQEDIDHLQNMGAASSTSIAIIHDNKLWGLIVCQSKNSKHISINFRLILTLIANTLAKQIFAIERVSASQDEERIAKLQASLTQNITKEDSLIYALDCCHPQIMELLFATGMSVFFQGNLFSYGKTPSNDEVMSIIHWLKENKLSEYTTSSLTKDIPESIRFKDKACGLLAMPITTMEHNYLLFYRPEFIHSIAWVASKPNLLEKNANNTSLNSFIETITKQSLPWTEYDKKSSNFICSLIVNKQLHDLLQIQAMHDPLTGLLNHLYLNEQLKIELLRASREKLTVSLIQAHIDTFRTINDEFGHQAGDIVLSVFAKLLNSYFREYDFIYRNGGEEFIILLPGMTHATAIERAKLLHANISKLTIQFANKTLPTITICTGIATYPENGKDPTALVAAARNALYQAKSNGPNQLVSANPIGAINK